MKSYANRTVRWGLVALPVKVYSAGKANHGALRLLHKDTLTPVGRQYVCPGVGVVPFSDLIRGVPMNGSFVPVTDEELNAMNPTTETIDVLGFVPSTDLPLTRRMRTSFLGPDGEVAQEAYKTFREALANTKRIAIAKTTIRGNELLVTIEAQGRMLVLSQLYYADEIPSGTIPLLPEGNADRSAVALASRMIRDRTSRLPVPINSIPNKSRAALMQLAYAKLAGTPITKTEISVKNPANWLEGIKEMLGVTEKKEIAKV